MLNKNTYKVDSFLIPYSLFFALLVAYSPFTGCGCIGVEKGLIPERNKIFSSLDIGTKKLYLDLTNTLDSEERETLEKKINIINDPSNLTNFIKQSRQNYIDYKKIIKLLPKPERDTCKQKFIDAIDKNDATNLIKQYQNEFKIVYSTSIEMKRYYTDLLDVLSVDKAVALKMKIIKATSPIDVEKLIMSYLPNSFKDLNEKSKADLENLSDDDRKDILKKVIANNQKKYATISAANGITGLDYKKENLSIDTLIQGKIQEQAEKNDSDIPNDEWGEKLTLRGKKREQFLLYTIDLQYEDKKKFRELFEKTAQDSLQNMTDVFFTAFTTDQERKHFLETMICLYKELPEETLLLCNDPKSVGIFTKYKISRCIDAKQIELLTRLMDTISASGN